MGIFAQVASALGAPGEKKRQRFKYRGVQFDGIDVGLDTGRDVVVHEFRQRDEPYVEDMRRSTRRYKIRAFVTGSDVAVQKVALVNACEMGGIATLVHPELGNLSVVCETCSMSEDSSVKSYVEFELGFVDAGSVYKAAASKLSKMQALAASFRQTTREFYAMRTQVMALNRKVQRLLTGSIEERMTAMLEIMGSLTGTDLDAFIYAVGVIADTAETLSGDADTLSSTWDTGAQSLSEPVDARRVSTTLSAGLIQTQAALAAGGDTATDQQILVNAAILDQMLYALAVARAAELTAGQQFASYEEAVAAAQALGDEMALAEHYLTDPAAYNAAVEPRASMVEAILHEAMDLPHQQTIILSSRRPALVLASELYDDAERAAEIVLRNGIADPGAVAGEIVVLTE